MKKRILSALLTLGMVLTMLPTAWAVDGTSGNTYGPEDDPISIEIGNEITLTGTKGATHSWTYHAGNGYLDDGMVLTSGEESEDTNQVSFQFTKAGTYSVTHIYRKNAGDFLVKSDAFKITVENKSPTVADLEMYTEYTETETLPNGAASATFAYVLTYHGAGGFSGVDQSFGSKGSIAMEATLTAANEKVRLVPVDEKNLDLTLPQGYYTVRYDNAVGSDAGSQVINEETIRFQVTDFGAINVGNSSLASDGGKSSINSKNVPKYSTITLNSGVFADVDTEEPGPEPSEYAAYIPQADGESVYYTQLDTALSEAQSGETVVLCKDLTDVAVTVDKSLVLDMNEHKLTGTDNASVITIDAENGDVTIQNGTISGGNATNGGGVQIKNGSVVLESCSIVENSAINGGGIYISGNSSVEIIDCDISYNSASNAGGAIHMATLNENSNTCSLVRTTVTENTAVSGGGISMGAANFESLQSTSTIRVKTGTSISNNKASKDGGGVYLRGNGSRFVMEDGVIFGNESDAGSGGAIYSTNWFGVTIEQGTISENKADQNGGGIYIENANAKSNPLEQEVLSIGGGTVITNNIAGMNGGGIAAVNAVSVQIADGVALYNNTAASMADDIYTNGQGGTLTLPAVNNMPDNLVLDDDGQLITGWYHDGYEAGSTTRARWSATVQILDREETIAQGKPVYTEIEYYSEYTPVENDSKLLALKAAHEKIVPIDPGEVPEDTWETSKSKTATNLDADYQSQVTLSLPASEEELVSDVVFVLDKSTSSEVEDQAIQMLEDLNKQIADTGATVKVGAVIFNKEANRVLELTKLNDTTMDAIVEAIQTEISSGTNTHAGLLAGEAMLDADTSVDANRKYLIFVSDGITYMYNEKPTAIGLQNGDKTNIFAGPDNWATKYGSSAAPDDWAAWLKEIESLLEKDSGYDYPYGTEFNGTDHQYIAYDDRANHAMSVDKALYLTYQTYQEIAAKYHCYSMVGGSNAASSHPWATSFMTYLSNGKNVTFDEIQKDIYYLLDEGSSVKDVIGYGEDYNFDFINSLDALTLTVGGEELDKEELIDPSYTDPYVTSAYGFGASDGTYQFVLNYYEKGEDGQSDECFVWEINVPVSNFAPVQLTYTVQLTNPKTESGTYGTYDADGSEGYDGLYTNNEATLYPVDSNGVPGQAENFYRPTVSYTVGTVSITPADITIYTGGDGYDSVVNGSGNEIGTTNNGLPTPGFYIELPHEVDQALKEAVGAPLNQPLDLSKYLTFTYDDGQGNTRTWHLERYDNKEGNDSMAYNRYIYRILPAEVNGEEIPIRLQFTDADGAFMTSDDFTVSLDELFHKYDMTIYAGDLNKQLVKAVLTVNDAETEYDATVESGELTVRGVTDNGTHTTNVVTEAPTNVTSVTAQVGENAKFYINGSELEVINPDDVKLLVDSLVPDQNNTLVNSALDEFDAIPNDYDYEARYLDLVDTSNGNAYVTTDDAVVVYWAYPEGTDKNTEFHLVHYVGLDRNDNNDLTSGTYTMEYYSEEHGNLETTEKGIRFTVNSFSPFALFWEDDSNNGGGGSSGGGGGSKPELNKEDHIAYVSGYPDGTVQPEGYITREEVATIFFRLLTDESRADFITDYNPYPDVASDRWSYYAITTMTNGNLMLGRTGGVFDPGANITRAEFAVVAAQFSNAQYSGPDKFTDISDHWARDYINRAANEGWIAGYPDGTFGPDRFITRAEVMALVNEVLERAPDADYMLDNMTVWPDNPKSAWYYEDVQEATNSHSYVWRNTQHTSEDWEDFISMRTFNELVRDAFNAAN